MSRPDRKGAILGFREVEVPARTVAFEDVVADLKRAAAGVYALALYLGHTKEPTGSDAAVLLSEVIERRCEALQRLVEQAEGEGRADG